MRLPIAKRLTVDIWLVSLGGRDSYEWTFRLITLLGHVLHRTDIWKAHTHLRLLTYGLTQSETHEECEAIRKFLYECRLSARVVGIALDQVLVPSVSDQSEMDPGSASEKELDAIRAMTHSGLAAASSLNKCRVATYLFRTYSPPTHCALAIIPLPPMTALDSPGAGWLQTICSITQGLPPVLMVQAAEPVLLEGTLDNCEHLSPA